MKNEKELLSLFYDAGEYRENLRQPFLQDGKVCASDGYVLIRIDKSICKGRYLTMPKGLQPPDVSKIMPKSYNMDKPLTAKMLREAMVKVPEDKKAYCLECHGKGMVTWTYRDRKGIKHERTSTCPECDGFERVKPYRAMCQYLLHGCYLVYKHLAVLFESMSFLGTDELRLRYAEAVDGSPKGMLFTDSTEKVEILIMPRMYDDEKEVIKIV